MFRNKEIKILYLGAILIGIISVVSVSLLNITAGLITFGSFTAFTVLFICLTRKRYQDIKRLTEYLASIYSGQKQMDIRDNKEGELSILKNDIYKVTLTLYEQSELLKKDKIYLSETLSNISHQLKTPLTSMFVMTDLLGSAELPQDKKEEFLGKITNQLKRIEWLVTSLLKLSKIDAQTVMFKREQIPLRRLLEKAVEPLLIPVELKEQDLVINGTEDITVTVDVNWTAEALLNIVKNCMEHTPQGGSITITCQQNPLYTEITVADNGEGIDKEDMPHIFERFYKGKNAGPDSIGIGLAMSKTILNSQNGTVSAKAGKEAGTKFFIRLYRQVV
ncbi:HAMP domain-containing sensor histidine kinase [Anaerocolumna sp. AGMB13025]|uniref:sensor histidine kinase n=1 Tax=Anaerocolumna sp. AGMB13025 TaxID=3039116 RepID=UPI00241F60E3|nr:HAMP domain-containing sensor histidine kinase [Anaerocolumna sp. AGMB13025]WFR58715.1 HAMP domain-containing sensor histidine kinase [Anaerocolumna sp. AGMB13025]